MYLYDNFHEYQDPLVLIQFIDLMNSPSEEITFNTYDLFNLEATQFINYYMKEFCHTGFYRPCENNKFPLYQPSPNHPLIFDGIDTVYEQDATWILLKKHFTLSTPTDYYALYYRLSDNISCNNILRNVFGQRCQNTIL